MKHVLGKQYCITQGLAKIVKTKDFQNTQIDGIRGVFLRTELYCRGSCALLADRLDPFYHSIVLWGVHNTTRLQRLPSSSTSHPNSNVPSVFFCLCSPICCSSCFDHVTRLPRSSTSAWSENAQTRTPKVGGKLVAGVHVTENIRQHVGMVAFSHVFFYD